MSKLSELVEELQEELAETKNQLSSLEEEHELLENSFEMYKEDMKKSMENYKQFVYMEIIDLRRSLENLHREIAPAFRGKSFIADTPEPRLKYDPQLASTVFPPNAKLDYRVERTYDPNTNTYIDRKVLVPMDTGW